MASRKEYEMLFRLNAEMGSGYSKTFQSAQKEIASTQQEIKELMDSQSDISAYQRQQSAIEATQKKLELLQQQYANIQQELDETGGKSSDLKNKLLAKQAQIDKTSESIEKQTAKLHDMGDALQDAGIETSDLAGSSEMLRQRIEALRQKQIEATESAQTFGEKASDAMIGLNDVIVAVGVTEAISKVAGAFKDATDSAIEYESAITGVYKTVNGTDEQLASISDEIMEMATEMPATTTEIAAVAEAAGQLGIATGDITSFTQTMINMGEATNLTADEAATALAKFANIAGTSADDYNRLGSVIVDLGNNFATTEADITRMATRLASAGTLAGLSEPEILALAAAMSSVGIEAEAGGTAMTQTLNGIEKAVANGKESLQKYAEVSGMTAEQFKDAWNNDAVSALTSFIAGLGRLNEQGESAVLTLMDLGLTGVNQSNMLQSLGLAADMMGDAVSTANTAWQENIALTNEANKRYATTESQQDMMSNAANNLAVTYGELYTPALREAYGAGTDMLVQAADFVEENPALVKGVTTFAGVMGGATAAITAFVTVQKVATAASVAFTAATSVALGPIALGVAAVGALAGAAVAVASAYDEANVSVSELTEVAQGTTEAIGEAQSEFDSTTQSVLATAQVADTYISKLEDLEAAGLKTEEAQRQYHNTLLLLSNAVPELSDLIDTQTDTIKGGTAALRDNAQAWEKQAKAQAYQEYMSGVMEQYNAVMEEAAANEMELTKAQIQAENAAKGMDTTYQSILKTLGLTDEQFQAIYGSVDTLNSINTGLDMVSTGLLDLQSQYVDYRDELGQAQNAEELYQTALDESSGALEEAQNAIDEASEAYDRLTESTSGSGEAIGESAGQIKTVLSDVDSMVRDLADSYTEAYTAALESIEGQYSLWDEAAVASETSIGSINSALQSQIDYWNQYNENLSSLKERADDITGLSGVISSFADGSAESVNAIAGMAAASDEDLQQMVDSYNELQEAQTETTSSLTDLATNFSAQMDELQASLVEDIEGMNLSDEARQSGIATIQGFIDAADSDMMHRRVLSAYTKLGNIASNALRNSGSSGDTAIPGYASGTENADAGLALVGESGPELVLFGGGEKVIPAEETRQIRGDLEAQNTNRAILASEFETPAQKTSAEFDNGAAIDFSSSQSPAPIGGISIDVSPVYHIYGSSNDGLQQILAGANSDLKDYILDVVEEAKLDERRTEYK